VALAERAASSYAATPTELHYRISSDAAANGATQALRDRRPAEAAHLALIALNGSPLNTDALSVLVLAQRQAGNQVGSDQLLGLGSTLGWRNASIQLWTLQAAVAQGLNEVAILRADALLRQNIESDRVFALLRAFAAESSTREVLVARLATRPHWRVAYLEDLGALTSESFWSHEALLTLLRKSAAPPNEREENSYLFHLMANDRYRQARALWIKNMRADPEALISDPSFSSLRADGPDASPFGWTRHQLAGATVQTAVAPTGSNENALEVEVEGIVAGRLLDQVTVLPAGQYSLSLKAREGRPGSFDALSWTISCIGERAKINLLPPRRSSLSSGWTSIDQAFEVPAQACPAQRIELRVQNAFGGGAQAWFERAVIRGSGMD